MNENPQTPTSLELREVEIGPRQREILRRFDLRILPGELFVLLGSRGSGKTAMLRAIAGLDRIRHGGIWSDDREVTRLPVQQREMVLMQPGFPMWPHLTVSSNLTFVLKHRGLGRRARNKLADTLLETMGLSEFTRHLPGQLTASQRQRVALARSLAAEAPITLLDEPFSAQDPQLRDRLLLLLDRHHAQHGQTMVVATDDPYQAMRLADRMAVLGHGEIAQVGTPRELYDAPTSRLVAGLLGWANLIAGEIEYAGEQPLFRAANGIVIPLFERRLKRARQGWAMFRPHDLSLIAANDEPFGDTIRLTGRVTRTEFRGSSTRYVIDLAGETVCMDLPDSATGDEPQLGDNLVVGIDPARIRILEH